MAAMGNRKLGHSEYHSRMGHHGIGTQVYTTGSITSHVIYYRDMVLSVLTDFGDRHYRLVLYRNTWDSRYHLNRAATTGLRRWLHTHGIRTGYHSLIHSNTARTRYGTIPVLHNSRQPRVWR